MQGYAGTGKTRMLNRTRALLEKRGFKVKGLAPSASASQTLAAESGIESETLQRFLARNAGVAAGRLATETLREQWARVLQLDEEIARIERRLGFWHRSNDVSRRIAENSRCGRIERDGCGGCDGRPEGV